MKKVILSMLLVAVTLTLFVGCLTTNRDDPEAYDYIYANIDDSDAIGSYLEKKVSRGFDIDDTIMGGDTVLMLAARYTTNIEVLKVIVSYYPEIHERNNKTDMSALDYLSSRKDTGDMYKYLVDASVQIELKKKANSAKEGLVKGILNKF